MLITHKLHMDLEGKEGVQWIEVSQWDTCTRHIRLALFTGPVPWVVPDDVQVRIQYRKTDGTGGDYDTLPDGTSAWLAEGNMLTLRLAPQVLTAAGKVMLQASILQREQCLHTFAIEILVRPILEGGDGEKSGEYTYLTGILPVPKTGEVGQFLRIAQVDDRDRVTCVEAVDAPQSRGSDVYILSEGEQLSRVLAEASLVIDPNGDADLEFGTVKSVNGVEPDENGNVEIETGGVKSVNGVEPDEQGNVAIETGGIKSVNGVKPDEEGNVAIETSGVKSVNGVTPDANGNVQIETGGAISLEDLLPAEVILPETNPMFYDGFLWISQAFTLVDGEEYIVNWNGTEYRCICTPMEYGGMAGLGLGNIGAVTGGANTGEPFVVAALDADSAAYTGFPGLAADLMGATSATVSICEPKKIPDEYLPEKVCYLYGATGTYNYLYNSPDTSNALNRTTAARLRKLVENGTTVWFVSSDSLLDTYVPCHISFNKEFGYGAIMIGIPGLSATNATYFTAEFVGQT